MIKSRIKNFKKDLKFNKREHILLSKVSFFFYLGIPTTSSCLDTIARKLWYRYVPQLELDQYSYYYCKYWISDAYRRFFGNHLTEDVDFPKLVYITKKLEIYD